MRIALGLALLTTPYLMLPLAAQETPAATPTALFPASPAVVNPPARYSQQHFLSLDGDWTFCTDPDNKGETDKWAQPKTVWPQSRSIRVPGCWEAQGVGTPGEHNLLSPLNLKMHYVEAGMKTEYEGIGWYRKEVLIPATWAGQQLWLKFGGVNSTGRAYVNGSPIADLGGAGQYCGTYKYNVTDLIKPGQKAVIVVMVRNDVASSKGSRNVARRYGGIDGSVEIEATPSVLIDYADVLTDAARQTATVNLTLRHVGAKPEESTEGLVNITVRDANGNTVGQKNGVPLKWTGDTGSDKVEIPLSPCALWSPEHPALHTAEITLLQNDKVLHGWTERFGVANWTVQGTDILLNGKKFFARGIGFCAHWPIDIAYPLDRARLREFMALVKSHGYNYLRHWAHTPPPEFCDAAAEAGVCLTVEMPYYHDAPSSRQGHHWDPLPKEYDNPPRDLNELLTQYRRYPSICTFSGGNEGGLHTDLKQMLKTVHEQAPGKLWTVNTGHVFNRPGVADYNADYFSRGDKTGKIDPGNLPNFPHILHEYGNPAYAFDPRNSDKYTTGYLSPIPLVTYKEYVAKSGLSWTWANAVIDASQEMTFYYQKLASENARVFNEPPLNGYHTWGSLNGDTHFFAQQEGSLLDPFLGEKKGGTTEYYHQFNAPVVLLCKITPQGTPFRMSLTNAHGGKTGPKVEAYPEQLIFVSGQTMNLDFYLSNFSEAALAGKLDWSINDGSKILIQNSTDCSVPQGGVVSILNTPWTVPDLTKATRLTVTAKLHDTDTANTWDIWAFPRPEKYSRALSAVAATPKILEILKNRYPGLVKCEPGQPLEAGVNLLLCDDLASAKIACEAGKRVLLLGLNGFDIFQPPVHGGEWGPNLQEGTALDTGHPVFQNFPVKEFLEPVFTRLMGSAARTTPAFQNIHPIIVGAACIPGKKGKTLPDFLLYAFETTSGKGRLLATGLNLLSDAPESVCLLDGFLAYAQSEQFNPKGSFDIDAAKSIKDNGRGKILQSAQSEPADLFLGTKKTSSARTDQPDKPLIWETQTTPASFAPGQTSWEAVCFVGMGAVDEKPVTFTLSIDGKPVADLTVSIKDTVWQGSNGVRAAYQVKESATEVVHSTIFADQEKAMGTGKKSAEWQSSGLLRISIPIALLTANSPATLKMESKTSEGRGWFGIINP